MVSAHLNEILKVKRLFNGFPMEPYGVGAEVRYRLPKVTIAIIAINVLLYLVTSSSNTFVSIDTKWLYTGGFIPLLIMQDLSNLYRILTSMFLHADILHIFFNMYFLYIFGKAVENTLGGLRFLALYIISGVAASIFHTAFSMLQGPSALAIPAIGASGAISGVLGAYLMLYPGTSLTACWFFFFMPMCFTMSAAYYLIFWFALQVIYGYARLGASIAFFAHAGGFVTGIALLPLVIERYRHEILRIKSSTGSIFDFIVYGMRRFRGGLPSTAKALLAILIALLLAGAAYVTYEASTTKPTGLYVAKVFVEIPSMGLKYVDNVVLKEEDGGIKPTDIPNDETRILLNRLFYAKLLVNPELANKDLKLQNKEVIVRICNVNVPLIIERFEGHYGSEGLLVKGEGSIKSRVVRVTYIGNICRGFLGSWIDYIFRIDVASKLYINEGITITAFIASITSLIALYVTLKKDRELTIVS